MRILLARAGALGDLLLLRAVVASLRHAGADVTLLAPEKPASALIGPGPEEAQRVLAWDGVAAARLLAGDEHRPALREAVGSYDVALCYSRSPDLARGLEAVAGRVLVHDPAPREGHAADWLARPLGSLGVARVEPPGCRPTPEESALAGDWCARLPPGFLAVHPGSGAARKNWPIDRFREVARRHSSGRPWLLSLGPAEPDVAAPGAVVARDLPPRHLGAILAHAGLYVGNDSGVTHLAAAWGAPVVALFGPTDPGTWAPLGRQVRVLRAPDGSMESLSVEAVSSAL